MLHHPLGTPQRRGIAASTAADGLAQRRAIPATDGALPRAKRRRDMSDSGVAAADASVASAGDALLGLAVDENPEKAEKAAARKAAKAAKAAEKEAKAAEKAAKKAAGGKGAQKTNRDGMEVRKAEDFGAWFTQLVTKAEMIEFYDISGCYILRPWSYAMWDSIHDYFDKEIKKLGVQNAYFPLFVSKSRLEKEEDHIEGFAAEVAWVTKSGSTDLEEMIAVRPTSETIMYPAYAKWIRSHRDLPLKLNQWSNVVRWEFKSATPFIRSREFLWQEGHTAFATKAESDEEVLTILDLYRSVYEDLLAVPVIKGTKSAKERFAGGLYTTTVEGFISTNGRAIQGATSHSLGQNFSKMFDITFESGEGVRANVWQNSWGLTTRTIGVMAMVHGDDKGLVLPPRVAPLQVVIVPIPQKSAEDEVDASANALLADLLAAGVRAKCDDRRDKKPGWKFSYWELKGVPLRVELGPRDIAAGKVAVTRRYDGKKAEYTREDAVASITDALTSIQADMLDGARKVRDKAIMKVGKWEDFVPALDQRCMVVSPWCEVTACEEDVKERSKAESLARAGEAEEDAREALSGAAKTLCIPFKEEIERLGIPSLAADTKCFACSAAATALTLWGRSY
jgi:prolyl-tRNA synthetase